MKDRTLGQIPNLPFYLQTGREGITEPRAFSSLLCLSPEGICCSLNYGVNPITEAYVRGRLAKPPEHNVDESISEKTLGREDVKAL